MAEPTLTFAAEEVSADRVDHGPACVVYTIAFVAGDPAEDGHAWTFSRASDVDAGVCAVREIQRATVYGGIERFRLSRSGVARDFTPAAAAEVGCAALRISFDLDDEAWRNLADTARDLFGDDPCFELSE